MSLFVIRHDPETGRYIVQRGFSRNRETILEVVGEHHSHDEAVAQVHRLRELELHTDPASSSSRDGEERP